MKQLIDQFMFYLAVERGLSSNYQISTQRSLDTFAKWLSGVARISNPEDIKPGHFAEFLTGRKHAGLAAASVRLEAVALRNLFRFLFARRILSRNPAENLAVPRVEKYLPEVLSVTDMTRLIESVSEASRGAASRGHGRRAPTCGHRDRAILELLYGSGLRVSELCDARLECLNLDEGIIRVTGKGNKTRLVPVGSHAREALRCYLELERPKRVLCKRCGPRRRLEERSSQVSGIGAEIFLSRSGHKLTPQWIWQLVRRYAARAGLGENVYPHMLRHSFATHLLTGGCDLRVIQELLGHENISTTEIYTHLDLSHLQAVHKKCHPRASFKTESELEEDFPRRVPSHQEYHAEESSPPSAQSDRVDAQAA